MEVIEKTVVDEEAPRLWKGLMVKKKFNQPCYPLFDDCQEQVVFDTVYRADAAVAAQQIVDLIVDGSIKIIGETLLQPIFKKHVLQT